MIVTEPVGPRETNRQLHQTFSVYTRRDGAHVAVFESASAGRNVDRVRALDLVMKRLVPLEPTFVNAEVETMYTRRNRLGGDQCDIQLRGRDFPVSLEDEWQAAQLRLEISAGMERAGRPAHVSGRGSRSKRFLVAFHLAMPASPDQLVAHLNGDCPLVAVAGGSSSGPGEGLEESIAGVEPGRYLNSAPSVGSARSFD